MSIPIKDVVSLTGVPGLFKIIKADDKAIIVESLDDRKKRQIVKGNMMVSKLSDVSIYTDDESESVVNVLLSIKDKYEKKLPVTKKSSKNELMNFLAEVLPNYDREKVYPSNVKKLIHWYQILSEFELDWVLEDETEEQSDEEEVKKEETIENENTENKKSVKSKGETSEKTDTKQKISKKVPEGENEASASANSKAEEKKQKTQIQNKSKTQKEKVGNKVEKEKEAPQKENKATPVSKSKAKKAETVAGEKGSNTPKEKKNTAKKKKS